MGWGWEGTGQGGSKKSKPIPALPCGAGLKSCPIPTPPPLRVGENPRGAKLGGAGQNCHPETACPHQSLKLHQLCECGNLEIFLVTYNNALVAFSKEMHAINKGLLNPYHVIVEIESKL